MDMIPVAEVSDEQLVKLSLQNSDNFGILIERYRERLLLYIRRLIGASHPESEDILQETFIKIYLHLNDFDPSLKFSSWAYRIARNEAYDHGRTKIRQNLIPINNDVIEKIAESFNLCQNLDDKILKEKLNKILEKLDQKYREPLELFLLEEKSYEEISDILCRPVGTVGALISRGKKQLQKSLQIYVNYQ